MTGVRAGAIRCFVHSFKDGLLARLAHDLRLEVKHIELELGADGLPTHARFFPDSIDLVAQMQGGVPRPGGITPADRAKILATLRDHVLAVKSFPEITFAFDTIAPAGDGYAVRGKLTLHGHTRPLALTSRREGACQVAEVTLHQPDWGITPFSAMLGALKVKPDVLIRIEIETVARDPAPRNAPS